MAVYSVKVMEEVQRYTYWLVVSSSPEEAEENYYEGNHTLTEERDVRFSEVLEVKEILD